MFRQFQRFRGPLVGSTAAALCAFGAGADSISLQEQQRRRFEGKTIVITGGGGTFGRVGAEYFSREGAKVALIDVARGPLEAAAAGVRASGGECRSYVCDITDKAQVAAVIKAATTELGPIRMLWNNAGIQGEMVPTLEYSEEDFAKVRSKDS